MSKEIMVAQIVGEYEGKKHMLARSSDEMYRMLPVNESGEVSAEALFELNEWIDRQQKRILDHMVKALLELNDK